MAIVTIDSSKATVNKVLEYITRETKASTIDSINLDPNRDFVEQMKETARLFGKAQGHADRKYYHLKLAFKPEAWVENGGILSEEQALSFGMKLLKEFFPDYESIGSIHVDKGHLHFHGVVNAVSCVDGRKLDMRQADYRRLKDRVQEMCQEQGLSAIDWRKATAEKRKREGRPAEPTVLSFAEQGMKNRGQVAWKQELRFIIDQAAQSAKTMDAFREMLEKKGVILTRCSANTISYKLRDRRACRGDTLGANYTVAAIQSQLERNRTANDLHRKIELAEAKNAGRRVLTPEQEYAVAQLAKSLSIPRDSIMQIIDTAVYDTWEDRQRAWQEYRQITDEFWRVYKKQKAKIDAELDELYILRQKIRQAEWLVDPRNSRPSLTEYLYATLSLPQKYSLADIDREIEACKRARERLRQSLIIAKNASSEGGRNLKQLEFDAEAYLNSLVEIQQSTETAFEAILNIPLERQYVLTPDYRLVRKDQYRKEMINQIVNER